MQKKQISNSLLKLQQSLSLDLQKMFDNPTLTRYLMANNNNIKQTIKSLESFASWKHEIDIENQLTKQEIKQLKSIYPHGYSGIDRLGRPVYVEQLGKTKVNELFKFMEDNKLLSYVVQRMQHLTNVILPAVKQNSLTVIIDINGPILKMTSKRIYNIINNIISVCQKYYPGLLETLYFTNTPMLFQTAWNFIKQGISKQTLSKIRFLGSDYEEELLKIIDKDNLPEFLGGQVSESCFLNDNGPWKPNEQQSGSYRSESDQQQQFDFSSLKAALTNIIPNQNLKGGLADTPLNTENDEKH